MGTLHVSVLGLGRMGRALARRLLAKGHEVTVYNRSPGKADDLVRAGAGVASRPRDAVRPNGLVLSTLTDEPAVRAVCEGADGILAVLEGGVHLGLSTLAPDAAARLAEAHRARGSSYVSAPVQGRPDMAEAGQLVAWVSGAGFNAEAREVLGAITSKTLYLGDDVRQAAAAKLALNMLMNANIELFAEAMAYVSSRGVDTQAFGQGLTETVFAAPLFRAIVGGLSREHDTAGGSDVRVSRKDLGLLVADAGWLELPVAAAVEQVFARAEAQGLGDSDPTAVRRLLRKTKL